MRSKTQVDYLTEPKPLINCLISAQRVSPKRRSLSASSAKTRPKSVGSHLSTQPSAVIKSQPAKATDLNDEDNCDAENDENYEDTIEDEL